MSLSIHSFASPITGAQAIQSPEKLSLSGVLQQFLTNTLSKQIQWKRHTQKNKQRGTYEHTLTAQQDDIEMTLTCNHLLHDGTAIPNQITDWSTTLSKSGKKPKILDGKLMHLPDAVKADTLVTVNTLQKLFRAAFEANTEVYNEFAPLLDQLTEQIKQDNPDVSVSSTFIPPSLAYPEMGSASVIQIKTPDLTVEITRFSNQSQVVLRKAATKTIKLGDKALANPVLSQAVEQLIQTVNLHESNFR